MAVKRYKPTTPGRRGMTSADTRDVQSVKPKKSLVGAKKSSTGRNHSGRITSRRRGGGAKRRQRRVSYQLPEGAEGWIQSIEYDPNRSSHVALVRLDSGEHVYIIAGSKMRTGQRVAAGEEAPVKAGNRLPLAAIPLGSSIYNIELKVGGGGQLVRSAGARARLTSKEGDWAHVRLPSGEVRLIHLHAYATLGNVGNEQHQNVKVGSAGRNRRRGKRPSVRGKAMNPADHPMGGGEGLTGPGRLPRTPWGSLAIGKKTRKRKRGSQQIVRGRKQKKR